MTARLRGHVTTVDILVQRRALVAERSHADRRDDFDGPQIHFVYAVVAGGRDERRDQDGFFGLLAGEMQAWLGEVADMRWRIDTYNGDPDVSFISLETDGVPIIQLLRDALIARERGRLNPDKKYAIFLEYDGRHGRLPYTGVAGNQVKMTLIQPHYQMVAGIAAHELIHTFGAVPRCAPNFSRSHVNDHRLDIMSNGSLVGGLLDWNNDDYFGHGRSDCLDTAHSPFGNRDEHAAGCPWPAWKSPSARPCSSTMTRSSTWAACSMMSRSCTPRTALRGITWACHRGSRGESSVLRVSTPRSACRRWMGTRSHTSSGVAEGRLSIEPAFVLDARPTLPERGGACSLTGSDAGGSELFALNFAMQGIADVEAEEAGGFASAIPARAEWADELATITLRGPEGSVALSAGDTTSPATTLVLDAVTGRVRAILREAPLGRVAADGDLRGTLGTVTLFRRGIPDAAAWRR